MARKKVVLFIVEGTTDRESLEILLQEIIEAKREVVFKVVGGDITSNKGVNSDNIKNKINNIIKDGGKQKFKPSDYLEVIHLVDTDAVFISEKNIYKDKSLNKFVYKEDGIYAKYIERVIERNTQKKNMLNLLSKLNNIYGSVPYRIFYFSCNLEHVLYNEMGVRDRVKMRYAEEFQDKYIDDIDGFIDFICNSDFTVDKSYKESWEFIKKDNNSIKRFTNFNILLKDYLTS